ncbi:biosynthetic-type acetolactate synthase large subunit [Desulfosporosinus meridiei]|uniref:Acetolactate synthase n=1 Tax=Desulfosporosinus meridiei (strain ATCC BAA-275 / DSM 13257 / KCTC 12902 / NCIMB 13706 / S10) TaxID=768704 RepID=J7IU05_DESMD|nr:biosynthetic-type acetolactate synthase large subunit [Desulfosporosinus meridiei]AFQ45205.1 acetolactate synthase, large subunit [Desulfosporosinus meridiei DSM 13257]
MEQIRGTSLLVKALQEEGVDTIFGYPGGLVTDIFDELYHQDDIKVVLPRHEQALVHEADGYARSTGKVGVCLVTGGPGAANMVTGIATAYYDSVPLVCLSGQVASSLIGDDAFQEADIVGITRNICKHGVIVNDRKNLGRILKEAFYIARTGKPGPVLVDLPKNVMVELGSDEYPDKVNIRGYKPSTKVHIGQLKKAIDLLNTSKKPIFLIGGGVNIAGAQAELTKLVELTKIPVVTTMMGKGSIDTKHPYYLGNVGMHGSYAANMAVTECDLLFSIGTRFSDRVTSKISEFARKAKIVHIDIDSAAISKNIKVDIPIVADAKEAITAMLNYVNEHETAEWLQQLLSWQAAHPLTMQSNNGLTAKKVIDHINETCQDAIVVTDVGQHQMWTIQFLELNRNMQLLTSGGMGTMGYGFPAALGAKLGNEDKTVICISGDGGMQMNIQELATAVAEELPVIICLFNNSSLGMVRQVQTLFFEKNYSSICTRRRKSCPRKCSGTSDQCPPYSPDFVALAKAYGAEGIRVTTEEEIASAFQQALENTHGPTIIEFIIDKDDLVLPMVQGGKPLYEMILEH